MKKVLSSLILSLITFLTFAQIPDASPYCNQAFDGNYNSINYMTMGSTTVNFGPLGSSANPNTILYYNTTVLPNLVVGTPMNLSINFYDAPDVEPMYFAVLIDMNQDQMFDVSEIVVDNSTTTNAALPCFSGFPQTINTNITIPFGVTNGPTRMRLVRYSDYFGPTPNIYDPFMLYNDCYSFGLNYTVGCTYDFNVNIIAPVVTVNPNALPSFSTVVGTPSTNQTYTVSAINMLSNLTLTAPTHFEISTTAGSGFSGSLSLTPTAGTIPNTTIYVRYNPSVAGSHNGFISHTCLGAVDQNVFVQGTSTAPIIPTLITNPDPVNLTPFTAFVGYPSAPQTYNLSGLYLSGNVNISAPAEFEISLTAGSGYGSSLILTPTAQTLASTAIYVRYNPGSVGSHAGNVSNYSTGSNTINIPVTGTASAPPAPSVIVTPTSLSNFNAVVGIPSATQTLSVSGTYLLGNVVLSLPAPFEISLTSGSGYSQSITLTPTAGMLAATTIYVRFNPQMPNTYTGDLTIASTAVTTITIPLNGVAIPNTPVVTLAPTSLNYFLTTFGIPSAVQSIAVSGMYLVSPLYVTAPQHWQISLNSTNGFGSMLQLQPSITGAVPLTTVFVRYNPQTPGNHQGDLTVTSSGALSKTMELNGYATPTGVETVSEDANQVYPTETSGTIYLSSTAENATISIYDFSGRKVLALTNASKQFSISHLNTGVYMLHVDKDGKHQTIRIVKK